ncbi:hypothetical protein [Sporichthya sp.]|uniref:hypothetical protein n=1 Tax=Sporichthya sp. TaxID=65475 RepID=UPI0017D99220|nr:hypothetical protein [Sporichthya sp.]MBA3741631.1 hypothetical protein [Sporichthya sp.]
MSFSLRSQVAMIWWAIGFGAIFGLSFVFLLHMVPPPNADMDSAELQRWYESRAGEIKIGATISSYTSGFMVPLFIVIGAQIRRHEQGFPVWTWATIIGGSLTSLFLVFPPLLLGVAAFTPGRDPDATAVIHEFAVLTLITTDQYFVFPWIALIVISLRPSTVPASPFPRWYGYFSLWMLTMVELGALAFNWKSGPFSWRGLPFYFPFAFFGVWIALTAYLLLRSIAAQRALLALDESIGPAKPPSDADSDSAAIAGDERMVTMAVPGTGWLASSRRAEELQPTAVEMGDSR